MATQNKTQETAVSVTAFLNDFVESDQKKEDSLKLIELMRDWSGFEAKMWGPTIIGFGRYRYKYPSGREGEAPLIAFSPRKAEFSLYVTEPGHANQHLLETLGKYRMAKACIYFKRLTDLDIPTLEALCKLTISHVQEKYGAV